MNNNSNIFIAIILSVLLLGTWQQIKTRYIAPMAPEEKVVVPAVANQQLISRDEALVSSKRIPVISNTLRGSIALQGARIDDMKLIGYKQSIAPDSDDVELLSPSTTLHSYFVELGWASNSELVLPNANTVWQPSADKLTPEQDLNLSWTNPQGVVFSINFSLDNEYMLNVQQKIHNPKQQAINLRPYALISNKYESAERNNAILHQGAIGAINSALEELSYQKLKDTHLKRFADQRLDWAGFTDKYWLVAFIPETKEPYTTNFRYEDSRFQVDASMPEQIVKGKTSFESSYKIFIGPKKVDLLDSYQKRYQIKLFDRAIDFGRLYLLTKLIFNTLNFLYKGLGNFGLSIIALTVFIKLLMFGLTRKSFSAMRKMKVLQPRIEEIRQKYQDKTIANQRILELYKAENVNPTSGCLPILLQIPVFFAIYKVLYITIEMRHAPFFGWIKDLSAPDPTSVFNLFGLLPFNPPFATHVGVWPILMSITMYLQQRNSPTTDPVQAQMVKFMPLIFLFVFSGFPAGLLIYWTCSNLISYAQQWYLNSSVSK